VGESTYLYPKSEDILFCIRSPAGHSETDNVWAVSKFICIGIYLHRNRGFRDGFYLYRNHCSEMDARLEQGKIVPNPEGFGYSKKGKRVGRGAARLNGINRCGPGSRWYCRTLSPQFKSTAFAI